MPNRLAHANSAYLLQHQNNPVDWFPWGEEAFAKAKTEQKPVFLSIGYSSCHWCHVMEHESFEDTEVAELLNEHFVSVKVDREERPDLDEVFMTAVQLSSGRGGWPMSVFLTPEKKPFFAGTYFPKDDRGQHPGFITVLTQIAKGWVGKRGEFVKAADEFSTALGQSLAREAPKTFTHIGPELLDNAIKALAADFDSESGGFGAAPKFPPHTALSFLLDYAASPRSSDELARASLAMALLTLEAMAMGGIHDQVGGGFHRYSTDGQWLVPHFEKMLYDNALLLINFGKAALLTMESQPEIAGFFAEISADIVSWLEREMVSENGLYGSALDADSEGEEGKFYVWTLDEIKEILGARADAFIAAYGINKEGNYHDEAKGELSGKNIIFCEEPPAEDFSPELEKLLIARQARTRPAYDDKQIIAWNALLISAFLTLGEMGRAERVAEAILSAEKIHGQLPRQVTKGKPNGEAFLDDHAALLLGLTDLALTTEMAGLPSAPKWKKEATDHANQMLRLFYDQENGGFFYTSSNHEELFGRSKPIFDQPIPSGNALAIQALIKLGDLGKAEKTLSSFVGWMESVPQATEGSLLGLLYYVESSQEEFEVEPAQAVVQKPAVVGGVEVSLSPKEIVAEDGKEGKGKVIFEIPEDLHLNSHTPPARWLIPTNIEIQPLKASFDYPGGSDVQYEGRLEVPFTVQLPAGESGADFELTVTYQACTNSECLEPQEKRLTGVIVKG
ncbi:MAG TPA: DUF255 domain-containing protein [Fimbriimonadaceae bacterium]|jgi:hypothetical protein